MAYTTISQVSVFSFPLANDLPLRRSHTIIPASCLAKGTSGLALNVFKTTKKDNVRPRIKSIPKNISCSSLRQRVTPLELEDPLRPPTNLYTAEAPHTATFRSVELLAKHPDGGGTYHIVFDHGGFVPIWEGQVFGVMPPNPENPYEPGDATKLNYFSAASSRYGDSFDGQTASLCVRRTSPGSTSDFLCSAKPGDKLQITGPVREAMILGDYNNPHATHIMIATGTGIAPCRSKIRRCFAEEIPKFQFSGLVWLLTGYPTTDSTLYSQEFKKYADEYPLNFKYNVALSREMKNKSGGKLYVQNIVEEIAEEIFDLLSQGAYIYFSGLSGMVAPVEAALEKVARERGLDWEIMFDGLKADGKWRVEVYG